MWQTASGQVVGDNDQYVGPDGTLYPQGFPKAGLPGLVEVPDPVVVPTPIVLVCSPRQIRMALTAKGLRSQVEAAVAAGTQDLKDWYNYATQFEQNNPMILSMATALGVSAQGLTDLFTLAVTL